ncbi:MAG: hypothetical protein R3F59_22030 [Myxococcota bacterium]
MRPTLPLLAFVVALAAAALRSAELQPWTLDDAYISFRYAEHWAAGLGPVYTVGERVEGYTCFLWVALLAAGHALGAATEPLSKALGGLAAAGTLALLTSEREGRSPVAAVLLGCCGAFSAWALSGMEVALVCLLVLGGWRAHLAGAPVASGLLGGLAAMTRPDALLAPLVQAAELAWQRRGGALLRHVGATALLFAPWWAARWAWYGWFWPNTAYAKVGATPDQLWRGLGYVAGAALPLAPVWLPALLLPLAPTRGRYAGLAAWIGLHLAYVVAVGGDVMPGYRFLVVALGPIALLAGVGLQPFGPRRAWAAAALLGAASLAVAHVDPQLSRRFVEPDIGARGREVGLWLRDHLPPDALVATNTAGSVPYFSGLPALDMLGLCDEHIAHAPVPRMGRGLAGHEKGDGAYVLSRRPAVVLWGAARGRRSPLFRSDRQLDALPAFHRQYRLERHTLPSGAALWLWRRTDVALR